MLKTDYRDVMQKLFAITVSVFCGGLAIHILLLESNFLFISCNIQIGKSMCKRNDGKVRKRGESKIRKFHTKKNSRATFTFTFLCNKANGKKLSIFININRFIIQTDNSSFILSNMLFCGTTWKTIYL